jgi:flagellar protein FlbD
MIALQRLNGQEFILNIDQIESIEATPDTRIRLTTGKTIIVKTGIAEVVKKCVRYRQLCNTTLTVRNSNEEGGK